MHKLVSQLPCGWWLDQRGIRKRSPGKAGDLAELIRKAPYTLRWNDLSKEVQLDGEHITADYLETAYVEFQEHGPVIICTGGCFLKAKVILHDLGCHKQRRSKERKVETTRLGED